MELGIFSRTFERPTLADRLAVVASHGLTCVQLDLAEANLPALPDAIAPDAIEGIRQVVAARGIRLAALSGTYNMIHPDLTARATGQRRLAVVIAAAQALGCPVVTLCTGTRDHDNMWRAHPDNATPAAWRDLVAALGEAAPLAEARGVTLAIEPEPGNVITSADRARELLDTLRSPRLKIVLDPANLLEHGTPAQARQAAERAIDLLGGDIALTHGKDRAPDGTVVPAGTGIVDFGHLVARLRAAGYTGALVLHGLSEAAVPTAVAHLRALLDGG